MTDAIRRIKEYILDGHEQAIRRASETGGALWSGKSLAYLDVLFFIEHEVEPRE